ncbi:MAG: hypothetical protein ACK4MV_20585 [Beijerinckiaceae bacterium]
MTLKHATMTGASVAFLALTGATFMSKPATAGPLAVTPKTEMAVGANVEKARYKRSGRVAVRTHARRGVVRYARGGYYGGRRYVYRRGYTSPFFPAAALGLFAGALGAAAYGSPYYCDPAYYTWNYGGCGYVGYYPAPAYYPAYYGAYPVYYGGYSGGYYPAYRARRVVYSTRYQRPRTVRYRAVAPRRHYIGSRTYVRSGYSVRRARR